MGPGRNHATIVAFSSAAQQQQQSRPHPSSREQVGTFNNLVHTSGSYCLNAVLLNSMRVHQDSIKRLYHNSWLGAACQSAVDATPASSYHHIIIIHVVVPVVLLFCLQPPVGVVNVTMMQASSAISAAIQCKLGTPFAMITNMAVTPAYRRRGIAHLLMQVGASDCVIRVPKHTTAAHAITSPGGHSAVAIAVSAADISMIARAAALMSVFPSSCCTVQDASSYDVQGLCYMVASPSGVPQPQCW